MSRIHLLQVKHGEAFVIECNKGESRGIIVVDGGPTGCGYVLQNKLESLGVPDLMVLTHYDDDHIGGLLQYVSTCQDKELAPAKEIWANCAGYIERPASKVLSPKQGVLLSERLDEFSDKYGITWMDSVCEGFKREFSFATIEVVSPTKEVMGMAIKKQKDEGGGSLKASKKINEELGVSLGELAEHDPDEPDYTIDNELANAASIAFVLRCDDLCVLMLGDCYPQNVVSYLRGQGYSEENPLTVDYVKVSHHGSKNNTSNELLDIIKCNHYIISTNGGKGNSNHPNRTTIAHILCHPRRKKEELIHLHFNYKKDLIVANAMEFINEGEMDEWNFVVHENETEL